ncbi:MAG: sulfotransferase family 2 domain-containing protein [Cyanobacterium sp. T60_A2020_053]|nr:sulfotransferase family 2 domain-containing protein [Cyanobacterium sp. T60_A2020_053]
MIRKVKKIWQELPQEVIKEIDYINHKPRKLLFDHLPKCGGLSIIYYLKKNYPRRKTYAIKPIDSNFYAELFTKFSTHKRYEYDLICGHGAKRLLEYVSPNCLTMTVFREPIERIISHYFFAKRFPHHYLNKLINEQNLSLEDYAISGISTELKNYYTIRFSELGKEEAEKNPQEAIEKALNFIKKYDLVGTLDNLPNLMKEVEKKANLKYSYNDQERRNVATQRPSPQEISPRIIETIKEVNHLDIILYQKIREIYSQSPI